jgi:hypothetical protein
MACLQFEKQLYKLGESFIKANETSFIKEAERKKKRLVKNFIKRNNGHIACSP